ncbi:alpha/beta hydrolase-fold protein [Halobacillus shinanisalinarum]|uniref:Alpha/beta hydrolase-fold protein n=1 Tax=Halobacillus shinanisalinarum TaxID=2932258 RepID=A0ABY4GV62_9BACI|nr:PHB depolymerase family esterase [Halobacillus shinanisalinarum]UOQ92065.1 alpha/beta hydrolase-fold protein [Halobacillus shinanisalinarum]
MHTYKKTIEFKGRDRTFHYACPQKINKPLPIVFGFHGAGSSARHHMKITRFHEKAEDYQMMAVFPEAVQLDRSDRMSKQWNEGRRKNAAYQNDVDDVGFIVKLIDWLKHEFSIDEDRVYATGFSNGSAFSMRIALECQDVITGVGGVAGPIVRDMAEDGEWRKSMPMLFIMGTDDSMVPYDGEYNSEYMIDQLLSAQETARFFAKSWPESSLELKEEITALNEPSIFKYTYHQHESVVFYSINGGGHTWPGGPDTQASSLTGEVNTQLDASQLIWDHLKNFRKE